MAKVCVPSCTQPAGTGSARCSAAPAWAVGEDCSGREGLGPPFLWGEMQFI